VWGQTKGCVACLDHNHKTGKNRGLLRNVFIGLARDSVGHLSRTFTYVYENGTYATDGFQEVQAVVASVAELVLVRFQLTKLELAPTDDLVWMDYKKSITVEERKVGEQTVFQIKGLKPRAFILQIVRSFPPMGIFEICHIEICCSDKSHFHQF